MTSALVLLAALAAGAAVVPALLVRVASSATAELLRPEGYGASPALPVSAVELVGIGRLNAALWAVALFGLIAAHAYRRAPLATRSETWGCGYAAPSARMQYSARSFSEFMSRLLPRALRAEVEIQPPVAPFPERTRWSSRSDDPLTRRVFEPFFSRWADRFTRLRWLQQGVLHVYLLYILSTALVALGWVSLSGWMGP
jgi:hypothetical protein